MTRDKTNWDINKEEFYKTVKERKEEVEDIIEYLKSPEHHGFYDFEAWYTGNWDWRFLRDIYGNRAKKGMPWDYLALLHLPMVVCTDAEGTTKPISMKGQIKGGENVTITYAYDEEGVPTFTIDSTGGGSGKAQWGYIKGNVHEQTDVQPKVTYSAVSPTTAYEDDLWVYEGGSEPGGSDAVWGKITGTLQNQSDLWNYIQHIPTDQSEYYVETGGTLATKYFVYKTLADWYGRLVGSTPDGGYFNTHAELLSANVFYWGDTRLEFDNLVANDYTYVLEDEDHKTTEGNAQTTRYIFSNGKWVFQCVISSTILSEEQIKALNSGITSEKVKTYDALPSKITDLTGQVSTLNTALTVETSQRKEADEALDEKINDEIENRKSADEALDEKIEEVKTGWVSLDTDQTITGLKSFINDRLRTTVTGESDWSGLDCVNRNGQLFRIFHNDEHKSGVQFIKKYGSEVENTIGIPNKSGNFVIDSDLPHLYEHRVRLSPNKRTSSQGRTIEGEFTVNVYNNSSDPINADTIKNYEVLPCCGWLWDGSADCPIAQLICWQMKVFILEEAGGGNDRLFSQSVEVDFVAEDKCRQIF